MSAPTWARERKDAEITRTLKTRDDHIRQAAVDPHQRDTVSLIGVVARSPDGTTVFAIGSTGQLAIEIAQLVLRGI